MLLLNVRNKVLLNGVWEQRKENGTIFSSSSLLMSVRRKVYRENLFCSSTKRVCDKRAQRTSPMASASLAYVHVGLDKNKKNTATMKQRMEMDL